MEKCAKATDMNKEKCLFLFFFRVTAYFGMHMTRMGLFTHVGMSIILATFCVPSYSNETRLPSFAFYYGINPPLKKLQQFDNIIVEPANIDDASKVIVKMTKMKRQIFAYVSLGEVHRTRPYYRAIPKSSIRKENRVWGSYATDQSSPAWREFFLSQVIAPLYEQGWRGFFIDTLDAYQLFAKTETERASQRQGLVTTLTEIKLRYPGAKLILNRGFELMPELSTHIYAMAAESLYRRYDAAAKQYLPVPEKDREWLLHQMREMRDRYHLPMVSVDYVDPTDPQACDMVRDTIERVQSEGFIAWVTDGSVSSVIQLRCQL